MIATNTDQLSFLPLNLKCPEPTTSPSSASAPPAFSPVAVADPLIAATIFSSPLRRLAPNRRSPLSFLLHPYHAIHTERERTLRLVLLHALPLDGCQWIGQMDILPGKTIAPRSIRSAIH